MQFSLNVLKSLNPQSKEIENINIFQDTDNYKFGGIYIRSPEEIGNQTDDSDSLIVHVFHIYPANVEVI